MVTFTLLIAALAGLIGLIPLLISEVILKKNRYNMITESIRMLVLVFGGATIGYIAGVTGPHYFWPDATLGPLLGIFITGPAGAILGLLVFWSVLLWKRKST